MNSKTGRIFLYLFALRTPWCWDGVLFWGLGLGFPFCLLTVGMGGRDITQFAVMLLLKAMKRELPEIVNVSCQFSHSSRN